MSEKPKIQFYGEGIPYPDNTMRPSQEAIELVGSAYMKMMKNKLEELNKINPYGINIDSGKVYTLLNSYAKGVIFFNKDGKEIGRKYFNNDNDANSFTAPKGASGLKFIAPKHK